MSVYRLGIGIISIEIICGNNNNNNNNSGKVKLQVLYQCIGICYMRIYVTNIHFPCEGYNTTTLYFEYKLLLLSNFVILIMYKNVTL